MTSILSSSNSNVYQILLGLNDIAVLFGWFDLKKWQFLVQIFLFKDSVSFFLYLYEILKFPFKDASSKFDFHFENHARWKIKVLWIKEQDVFNNLANLLKYLRWCIRLEIFHRLSDKCDDLEFSSFFMHAFLPFLYSFKPTQDGGRGGWAEEAQFEFEPRSLLKFLVISDQILIKLKLW